MMRAAVPWSDTAFAGKPEMEAMVRETLAVADQLKEVSPGGELRDDPSMATC